MTDFANLAEGGRRLAEPLRRVLATAVDPVLVPVLPNGAPVVAGIHGILPLPVVPLAAARSDDGVRIAPIDGLMGCTAILVDDGVETGTVARTAAPAMRASGAARLVLAVPVCPREALADLALRYDEVVAVARPLARRSLAWHYDDFDTVDEATALRILAELGGASSA
jgi:predicted phosphoribosyltransferase